MKREPTELEKIFANDLSDKGLNCPKCTKSLCDSKSKKENNPDKNGQRILTDIFPKKAKRWSTGTLRRFSPPLVIREIQTRSPTR